MLYMQSSDFTMADTCVAFGCFDGLHAGHREILNRLKREEKCGLTSVMLHLDDQPHELLRQRKHLTTREEMRRLLHESGPQVMLSHPLDAADTAIEPEEFITKILLEKMGARVVVVGANCRFGKNGRGDAQMLKEHAAKHGFKAHIVDTISENDTAITSDIIHDDLLGGHLERANRLLSYPYTLCGEVVHGKALGRGAKMPTANLLAEPSKLIPAHGVYATLTKVDGEIFFGLTNIGLRPTVDNLQHVTIETFLLDFSRDIYGKIIETQLCLFIREIRKFGSLDEVRAQIDIDLEQVRGYFDSYRRAAI